MPDSIVNETLIEVQPLSTGDSIGIAARRVIETGLPALPVVGDEGKFAGIFGEREFMTALFPGYVGELASARMVSRTMDDAIDRRIGCAREPVEKYLTKDAVVVDDDYSDTQLAELFLHHRVLVIPIAKEGRIHAVVTRNAFFRELVRRFASLAEDRLD